MEDNTPQSEPNKPPQPPAAPQADTHGVPPEVGPVEPAQSTEPTETANPEYQKWADETKDLPTAYKRYSDSSSEANRLREEKEGADTKLEEANQKYQAVEEDFEKLRQRNPELYGQVKEAVQALQGTVDNTQTPQAPSQPQQPNEAPLTEEQVAQTAKLEVELGSFRKDYSEDISSDEEFDKMRRYAASLSGKTDRDGKPFTLRHALVAALQYYKPEVLTDKVKMEAIANVERRNSASEPANVPGGSPSDNATKELSTAESEAAAFFPGMTAEEYRKNQLE